MNRDELIEGLKTLDHYRVVREAIALLRADANSLTGREAEESPAFKPCVVVNDETGITEITIEDVAFVAVPLFEGIHHYMDKLVAMDDGRLVGFTIWQTAPKPAPAPWRSRG